jgi:hypothetical protein
MNKGLSLGFVLLAALAALAAQPAAAQDWPAKPVRFIAGSTPGSVGDVVLRGTRLCEPCDYLQNTIAKPGALKALVHRAGLRCDIVSGGIIRVGDEVTI